MSTSPPTCTQTDTAALDQILVILDCIPPVEHTFVLGDFNAHLLGMDSFARTCCPCCDLPRQWHPGETWSRGRRLWAVLQSRNLLVVNGCNHLQEYICHTTSMQGHLMLTMVDYLIINHEALDYMLSILILDRPPCNNSKNFPSYLLLHCTTCARGAFMRSYLPLGSWGRIAVATTYLKSIICGWSAACILVNTWGSR